MATSSVSPKFRLENLVWKFSLEPGLCDKGKRTTIHTLNFLPFFIVHLAALQLGAAMYPFVLPHVRELIQKRLSISFAAE